MVNAEYCDVILFSDGTLALGLPYWMDERVSPIQLLNLALNYDIQSQIVTDPILQEDLTTRASRIRAFLR